MTRPKGSALDGRDPTHTRVEAGKPGEPISTLRGAGVEVDIRRVGRVLGVLCLVALAALVIVLFLAGVHKNAEITRLHDDGVPVEVTISGCIGLLGGSGSNAAGYQCRGSFTLDGHRYNEPIPGSTLYPPGSKVRGVAVPGDPALVAKAGSVKAEQPSPKVFLFPTILLVALVLIVGALLLRRRQVRHRTASGG